MSESHRDGISFSRLEDLTPKTDLFETQRREIGASYSLGNQIRTLAKMGIQEVKARNLKRVDEIRDEILRLFVKLTETNVPADLAWQFDSENGQEMVEFILFDLFYPFLLQDFDRMALHTLELPTFEDKPYGLTPQTWFAGLADVPGELGKAHLEMLCNEELTIGERLRLRRRWLRIAEYIFRFLDRFECSYPLVINASRRAGFFNTFRGKLLGIAKLIETNQMDLAREVANMKLVEALR